ncbi:MAG: thioredoxin fold domain-containing protein [bacterium]
MLFKTSKTILLLTLCLAGWVAEVAAEDAVAPTAIQWLEYSQGLEQASESGKAVFINFTADWCRYCKKMKKETYADPEVIAYISEHYVPIMVDTTKEKNIAARYSVRGLPTIWFLSSSGERISNLPGYVDAPMFLNVLRYIATGAYAAIDFEAFLKAQETEG